MPIRMVVYLLILCTSACAYRGSGRLDVKGTDFAYSYDARTNQCYASVGLTAPDDGRITQFSMTSVTCNEQIIAIANQPAGSYLYVAGR